MAPGFTEGSASSGEGISSPRRIAAGAGGAALLEAFKPGTAPPDSYSVVGYTDAEGRPTVSPDAERAIRSGTGGLY